MILPVSLTIDTPGVGSWAVEDVTLVGATITHGSDDLWQAPDPSTASFTMLDPSGEWRPRLGFTTRVTLEVDGRTRCLALSVASAVSGTIAGLPCRVCIHCRIRGAGHTKDV